MDDVVYSFELGCLVTLNTSVDQVLSLRQLIHSTIAILAGKLVAMCRCPNGR